MDFSEAILVIIPCRNEAKSISRLVSDIYPFVTEILVVDDGSTDATASLAANAGAEVIRHATPCGKGAALMAGWQWANRHAFGWVIMMDGDCQHSPQDLPRFLARAAEDDVDLIIGNRMNDVARMPWLRRWVNRWMSGRLSRLTGKTIPDSQCGFRMMRLNFWRRLSFSADHFEIESEMLTEFIAHCGRIDFVPIQTIYNGEPSRINPVRDTWRWFCWLLKTCRRPRPASMARVRRAEHQASASVE